jgi:hypothetical protein
VALRGIVHIAISHPLREDRPRYRGHWEDGQMPATILEEGPGWDDTQTAVAWGRERAPIVLVRVGRDEHSIYSAGVTPATRFADGSGEPYREWPGPEADPNAT